MSSKEAAKHKIRQATWEDCGEITRIWLAGQVSHGITLDCDYFDVFRHKLEAQDKVFQVWVAEGDQGNILGWQSLSPGISNPFMRFQMAEASTYVSPADRGKGIGRELLAYALKHAESTPLRYIIAFVVAHNIQSRRLIDSLGFKQIGLLPNEKNHYSPEWIFFTYEVPGK